MHASCAARPRRPCRPTGLHRSGAAWSAPRDVSGPHTFVDGLWADGGLIGWRSEDGEAGAPAGRSGDPVVFGAGRAAVVIVRPVGSNRDPRSELRVAFRSGGRFGASQRVVKHPRIAPEHVAPGEAPRAAFPGPTIAWQARQAGGVQVQEATRAG